MRAVIYCRVSTQQQTKNLSLPAQRNFQGDFEPIVNEHTGRS